MKNINTDKIYDLLKLINDTVQAAHPDCDDDVGAIVWNSCLALAEMFDIEL